MLLSLVILPGKEKRNRPEKFYKIDVLKNCAIFTGRRGTLRKKRLQYRCFSVNFATLLTLPVHTVFWNFCKKIFECNCTALRSRLVDLDDKNYCEKKGFFTWNLVQSLRNLILISQNKGKAWKMPKTNLVGKNAPMHISEAKG